MNILYRIINISRPRFWLYILGSFLIGIGAYTSLSNAVILNIDIVWWMIYFTLPANLFVYGINDLADNDTDQFNEKKGTYEEKISTSDRKILIISILLTNIPFLFLYFKLNTLSQVMLIVFFILNILYSLPPIRLKTRPFIDSISNGVICAAIGLFGYVILGGESISIAGLLAGGLWSMIMHAYSAIPDIKADIQAGVSTVATILKEKGTLWFCTFFYFVIIGIFLYMQLYVYILLVIPYLILMYMSFRKIKQGQNMFNVYKIFPFVTYGVGYLVYLFNVIF